MTPSPNNSEDELNDTIRESGMNNPAGGANQPHDPDRNPAETLNMDAAPSVPAASDMASFFEIKKLLNQVLEPTRHRFSIGTGKTTTNECSSSATK